MVFRQESGWERGRGGGRLVRYFFFVFLWHAKLELNIWGWKTKARQMTSVWAGRWCEGRRSYNNWLLANRGKTRRDHLETAKQFALINSKFQRAMWWSAWFIYIWRLCKHKIKYFIISEFLALKVFLSCIINHICAIMITRPTRSFVRVPDTHSRLSLNKHTFSFSSSLLLLYIKL